MAWRDTVQKFGFPVFIIVAVAAGAVMIVALAHRTPPPEPPLLEGSLSTKWRWYRGCCSAQLATQRPSVWAAGA